MKTGFSAIGRLALLAPLLAGLAACDATKSSSPLSPNVAGPIAGVSLSVPAPMSPRSGSEVVNSEPVRLTFRNSVSNGERPFWYVVELASDSTFQNKLYSDPKVTPAPGEQTTVVVGATLAAERTYFWRVQANDGANASEFSAPASFSLLIPVVISTPTPVSPTGGQTISSTVVSLVVNNAAVEGRAGIVQYWFEIARDQAFTNVVFSNGTPRTSGSTTTIVTGLPPSTLFYWRAIGTNGTVNSAWSAVQSFRTPADAPTPPTPPTPPPSLPGNPGCVNGLLSDPRSYFFALIGRSEGSSAGDWAAVMRNTGLPAGPVGGVRIPSNAPFYGITQQIDSSGNVRGRLFLPTQTPDAFGYYIQNVDILADGGGGLIWTWRPHGSPAYVPRACP